MASINTNYGAMVAAQSFAATSRELDKVQNRVTTGLKISSAKDNGAVWAIANTQKANAKALDATANDLLRKQSIADVGIAVAGCKRGCSSAGVGSSSQVSMMVKCSNYGSNALKCKAFERVAKGLR